MKLAYGVNSSSFQAHFQAIVGCAAPRKTGSRASSDKDIFIQLLFSVKIGYMIY